MTIGIISGHKSKVLRLIWMNNMPPSGLFVKNYFWPLLRSLDDP